ncbi:MAG: TIM barrel protein [Trueperaceae bacterium]
MTAPTGPTIRVANAPCSWGTIEGFGDATPWGAMLDQLAGTGYAATELGDLGYLPIEPEALRAALAERGLALLGGFEGVDLRAEDAVERHRARLLTVAKLLAAAGDVGDPGRAPFFILADTTCGDPERPRLAGRVPRNLRLGQAAHATFARNAGAIARLIAEETGLRTLFHHHCGAWVETPDEIARFLDAVPAGLVDLVFDTGHFTYGTGRPDADPGDPPGSGTAALDGLRRFWGRVPYVHLKDCDPAVAARARAEGSGYPEAVGEGVFCELGQGSVDLAGVVAFLRAQGYADWLTVEQDVLPGMGTPEASARRNRDVLRGLGL